MPLNRAVEMNAPRQDASALESSDSESDCAASEIDGNFITCPPDQPLGRMAAR